VVELLRSQGQGHVVVVVGGIIPEEDIPALQAAGIQAIFGPGATTESIAATLRSAVTSADAA
jgi:methylmalonyl-CoA mutase C-terminal domain/subunit